MKKIIALCVMLALAGSLSSQPPLQDVARNSNEKPQTAQRKFKIIVQNERNAKEVRETNQRLSAMQDASRGQARRGLLGELLWTGYTSAFTQKTVNASSNLLSLGINYIAESVKSKRGQWLKKAQEQCRYHEILSANTEISDFYALPSVKGAMDPENLKFEGFGCKQYIEVVGKKGEGQGVFYVFCKLRRDSLGLAHIVNHSKFLVELDSLVFNPSYCNLPNDSSGIINRFDFAKRDQLTLQLKARFYSSWMNQAIMIAKDQLLGEFTIHVKVDKKKLNSHGLFVYNKHDADFKKLISIDGDCFIVPRSYTGTTDGVSYQPSWGTGQYRIEMEVTEQCKIVESYYQIREAGNGETVAFADATPGKKRWDKAKWKTEWKAMNQRRQESSFLKNAWDCVVTAYRGSSWVATFTDPFATALYSWETQKLNEWVTDVHDELFGPSVTTGATAGGAAAMKAAGGPQGGAQGGAQGGGAQVGAQGGAQGGGAKMPKP